MTTIERLRTLLAGASEAPWQWLDSGGDPGEGDELQDARGEMIASGFRDDLGDRDGYVALTDGRLAAEGRNALSTLLDVVEAARELLVEAEIIRSRARALKPHPDTVSALRDAIDRLDQS